MSEDLNLFIFPEMFIAIQIAAWTAILVLRGHANSAVNKVIPAYHLKSFAAPHDDVSLVSAAIGAGSGNSRLGKTPELDENEKHDQGSSSATLELSPVDDDVGLYSLRGSSGNPVTEMGQRTKGLLGSDDTESLSYQQHQMSAPPGLRREKKRDVQGKGSNPRKNIVNEARLRRNKLVNLRARQEGDAIIGAMFPLHEHSPELMQCGKIWEHYGIHRVEAFIMTIDKINNDSTMLPHIKLGWDIRDSCWNSAIALENSIDFIRDAITSISKEKDDIGNSSASVSGGGNMSAADHTRPLCHSSEPLKPIIGLIGPGSSDTTVQVQNLLQIFEIPQIGYSATANTLSDKSQFQYYMRVVPPDRFQAQAFLEFINYFKWSYISAVHTEGTYGYRGMDEFKYVAKEKGVCIAEDLSVKNTASNEDYDKVLDNLMRAPNATVVVCFCEGKTVKNLLKATRRKNIEGRFLFIGSDGWGNRPDVIQDVESAAVGGISFMFYSPPLIDFDPHYASLTANNPKNPWFTEFWEYRFNCSLDRFDRRNFPKLCTGNESLAGTKQDSKLGFVANAVMTMAHALDSMHHDLCPGYSGLCPAMEPFNGSLYWRYLLNVSFLSYNNELVRFDKKGDPPGRYVIVNFQKLITDDGNVSYEYVPIGDWKNDKLTVNDSKIMWPPFINGTARDKILSRCSFPCSELEVKKANEPLCCFICAPCQDNEIMVDNKTNCKPCELGQRPDLNKTECEDIPVDYISWGETEAIVCITLACLGISVTLWIFVIFLRYKDTPIVKASTRELSYIILVGICLAFSANFFIVAKPTKEFCYLTRILPGLSFSLMYGSLVTRTNRIARILEGSKRIMTKKPKFMSATAQVVITGILIGIECAVIVAMLVYQPANSKFDYPSLSKVRLICDTSNMGIIVPLGFVLVLIIFCTIYAVKTRNLPENFNEAKFIGFTMYSTCVIWLGFFPIYFAGENKEITLSFSMSLSAIIALILLFVPKVYVIIWVPEKNTRGAFTTSKDVRCHIGSKSMASGDSIDIKESNTCENFFKSDKGHNKNWKQKSLDEKRLRFVMHRSGGHNGDSSYVNHGVLPSLSGVTRSTAFVNRDNSSDSTRTVSTPISSASIQEKERLAYKEHRENPGVEAIRQSLARDFPMASGKRQLSLRPGSPAEKEKHRIHNVAVVDLGELLSQDTDSPTRHGKPRDFRKSLSSTCVSTCQKTKTAECQTGDELVQFMLPPLRRRSISRNKLTRSGAVDDQMLPTSLGTETHHCLGNSSPLYHKPNFQKDDPKKIRPPSRKKPLVICFSQDRQALSSLPDLDSPKTSSLLGSYGGEHSHRRSSHQQPLLQHEFNSRCERSYSNDPLPFQASSSPHLAIPTDRSHRHSTSRLLTPDSTDFSFLEGVEAFENSMSPCYSEHRGVPKCKLRRFPEPGISPSSPCGGFGEINNDSEPSLLQDESCSSVTASTASSSFTLPPFQNSSDSNHSLVDVDSVEEAYNTTPNSLCKQPNEGYYGDDDEEEEELVNMHLNASMPLMGENATKTSKLEHVSPILSLEPLDREETEVLEFQKYLQGHGVKLDISTIQSSDL